MDRYKLLKQIKFELSDLLNELHYLRTENEELKEYKEKYSQLLKDSIKHGNDMNKIMMDLLLK